MQDAYDPSNNDYNDVKIKDPRMFIEASFIETADIFNILSTDQTTLHFWITGDENPRATYIEAMKTFDEWGNTEDVCVQTFWTSKIECSEYKVYCTEPTDIINLRIAVRDTLFFYQIEC